MRIAEQEKGGSTCGGASRLFQEHMKSPSSSDSTIDSPMKERDMANMGRDAGHLGASSNVGPLPTGSASRMDHQQMRTSTGHHLATHSVTSLAPPPAHNSASSYKPSSLEELANTRIGQVGPSIIASTTTSRPTGLEDQRRLVQVEQQSTMLNKAKPSNDHAEGANILAQEQHPNELDDTNKALPGVLTQPEIPAELQEPPRQETRLEEMRRRQQEQIVRQDRYHEQIQENFLREKKALEARLLWARLEKQYGREALEA
eukprot:GSA120T00014230001.1